MLSFKKDSTSTNRWINYIKSWHAKCKVKEAKLTQRENLSFNTQLNLNEFFYSSIGSQNISGMESEAIYLASLKSEKIIFPSFQIFEESQLLFIDFE